MSSGDTFVYQEALNEDIIDSNFISKQWLYVNDSNSGSYSGQVVLDSLALSNNSAGYMNWREAYILIPLVLELQATVANKADLAVTTSTDYVFGLKNGFSSILHSLSVEMDGQNLVQQTPFLNIYSHFKHLTSFSLDQIREMGCSFLFSPDTSDSWVANLDASGNTATLYSGHGPGFTNNRVLKRFYRTDMSGTAITGFTELASGLTDEENTYNRGLRDRCEWLQYNALSASRANRAKILTEANAKDMFKAYCDNSVEGKKTIRFVAKIELKHVCDFFQKCPTLMKGGAFKFYINVNQAECRIKYTSSGTAYSVCELTSTTLQNGTNPIMITSFDKFQPAGLALSGSSGGKEYTLSLSIAKNNFTTLNGGVSAHSLQTCRLYCCQYVLNPLAESQLIKLNPVKTVVYDDIQLHIQRNVSGNFNFLCTNGISNLKEIVVIPFLNSASNAGFNPLHNPCDPSVVHPIAVRNYNVQVSGKNLYQANLDYDWEQFHNELKTIGINSGMTDGLCSGLLSEYDYSNLYRYLYSNVARTLPSEEGVSRSVNLMGQVVNNALTVDFYVYMVYSKTLSIDIRSGMRVN